MKTHFTSPQIVEFALSELKRTLESFDEDLNRIEEEQKRLEKVRKSLLDGTDHSPIFLASDEQTFAEINRRSFLILINETFRLIFSNKAYRSQIAEFFQINPELSDIDFLRKAIQAGDDDKRTTAISPPPLITAILEINDLKKERPKYIRTRLVKALAFDSELACAANKLITDYQVKMIDTDIALLEKRKLPLQKEKEAPLHAKQVLQQSQAFEALRAAKLRELAVKQTILAYCRYRAADKNRLLHTKSGIENAENLVKKICQAESVQDVIQHLMNFLRKDNSLNRHSFTVYLLAELSDQFNGGFLTVASSANGYSFEAVNNANNLFMKKNGNQLCSLIPGLKAKKCINMPEITDTVLQQFQKAVWSQRDPAIQSFLEAGSILNGLRGRSTLLWANNSRLAKEQEAKNILQKACGFTSTN